MLDLGSGAGADVLISARRVGPAGQRHRARHDRRDARARAGQRGRRGVTNAEFVKGYIEDIPLPDASVDVVISNCVINLAADKRKVLAESARVLRPGGRFAVSDVIADEGMDQATRADMAAYTGCIAGALTRAEFERRPHRGGPDRHRDPRDPPRPRARHVRDHPRPQAEGLTGAAGPSAERSPSCERSGARGRCQRRLIAVLLVRRAARLEGVDAELGAVERLTAPACRAQRVEPVRRGDS